MKKLIAIAAVALVGAAFADCDTCNTCGDPCGFGYKLKVLLKTTASKSDTVKKVNTCNTCNTGCTTCLKDCYRKPVTKKLLGYVFGKTGGTQCGGCDCNDWDTFNFVLWNYVTKDPILVEKIDVQQFNRFGESKGTMAEMAFRLRGETYTEVANVPFPFDLQFAGFGNMGTRTNGKPAIKSVSGFCAGTIPCFCYDYYEDQCGTKHNETNRLSHVWTICGVDNRWSAHTAAYGKWVLAWDSPIVNRITAGKIAFDVLEIAGEEEGLATLATSGYTPTGFKAPYLFYAAKVPANEEAEEAEEADEDGYVTGVAYCLYAGTEATFRYIPLSLTDVIEGGEDD